MVQKVCGAKKYDVLECDTLDGSGSLNMPWCAMTRLPREIQT